MKIGWRIAARIDSWIKVRAAPVNKELLTPSCIFHDKIATRASGIEETRRVAFDIAMTPPPPPLAATTDGKLLIFAIFGLLIGDNDSKACRITALEPINIT